MPSIANAAAEQAANAQRAAINGGGSADRNTLAKDMNTFLTLLTTQLKNQDPLSPMDSTEFTNQLVQFAQVEQQISQNEKLDNLVNLGVSSQAGMAVQYIGYNVEAESNKLPLQNGSGRFAYGLTSEAKSVGIILTDATGKTAFTAAGEITAGVHEFKWDGKDKDGNQLEDGTYTISVTALDKDGASIDTWTTVFGTVDGVTTQDGEAVLAMGNVGVLLSSVLSVTPPPKTPADPGTDPETDPGTDPEPEPEPDPDTGTDPGTVTDPETTTP